MLDFIVTLIVASIIMATLMCITVAITMPFHGALVRLRANYNPRAVGLEGIENRCVHQGHALTTGSDPPSPLSSAPCSGRSASKGGTGCTRARIQCCAS